MMHSTHEWWLVSCPLLFCTAQIKNKSNVNSERGHHELESLLQKSQQECEQMRTQLLMASAPLRSLNQGSVNTYHNLSRFHRLIVRQVYWTVCTALELTYDTHNVEQYRAGMSLDGEANLNHNTQRNFRQKVLSLS